MFYRGAFRDMTSYAIIDPVSVTFSIEPAYNGYDGVVVIYDGQDNVQWACKVWCEGSGESVETNESDGENVSYEQDVYLIVYQKERMTAWKGSVNGSNLEPAEFWDVNVFSDNGNGYATVKQGASEMKWLPDDIPVVPFVHKKDANNMNGESVERAALTLQNELNTTIRTMDMAAQLGAYPTPVFFGVQFEYDDGIMPGSIVSVPMLDASGNPLSEVSEEQARLLAAVKHVTLEPANLDNYLNAIRLIVEQMMILTQTPVYGVVAGGNISGEALKQLEIGLIGNCERFQRENTDAWKKIIYLLRDVQSMMQNEVGSSVPNFDSIDIKWKTPEIRNKDEELEQLYTMREKAPGLWPDSLYREKIGALMDIDQKQIVELGDAADAEGVNRLQDLLTGGGATGTF